jgi:hypothetical protein
MPGKTHSDAIAIEQTKRKGILERLVALISSMQSLARSPYRGAARPGVSPARPADTTAAESIARVAIFAESNVEEGLGVGNIQQLVNNAPKAQVAGFLRQVLAGLPMCEGIEDRQIQRLIDAMEPCRLQPREVAVRAGEPNDYLYVIQSGQVILQSRGGQETLPQGSTFGQESLAYGGPSDYTAVGAGSCLMWRLNRRAFKLLQMDYGARLRKAVCIAAPAAAQTAAPTATLRPSLPFARARCSPGVLSHAPLLHCSARRAFRRSVECWLPSARPGGAPRER